MILIILAFFLLMFFAIVGGLVFLLVWLVRNHKKVTGGQYVEDGSVGSGSFGEG